MKLHVNGSERELPDAWADESLLAALREPLGLVGTKFGSPSEARTPRPARS